MRYWLRQIHREEEGVTLVIVVLSLVALFGMLVLVVDVGGLLWKRRELVNGSDAAALAAAQTCSVTVAEDGSTPEGQADTAAIANVNGLVATDGTIVDGLVTCRNPSGFVTVEYGDQQQLFFAPVLGFGTDNPVTTRATAAWGPLAAGEAVPIVLESSQFQGPCDVPDNVNIGDQCNFWYDNGNFAIGEANWGFLNLDLWDVAVDANCNSAGGAADRGEYIRNNFPTPLSLADPGPTYVCGMTGHATANWQDLVDRMTCPAGSTYGDGSVCPGDLLKMPVNDCDAQVDQNGNVVPCGTGTPDKFAIIGFTTLQISAVYRGDDPAAIGTPGIVAASGDCGGTGRSLTMPATRLVSLGEFADTDCNGPTYLGNELLYHVPYASVEITSGTGPSQVTHVKCPPAGGAGCDYLYNEDNANVVSGLAPLTLQWVAPGPAPSDLRAQLNWTREGTPGTPGACGIQQSDPNAICLVTTWRGFTSENGPVGSGGDFGTRGYLLCDFGYNSCPPGVNP